MNRNVLLLLIASVIIINSCFADEWDFKGDYFSNSIVQAKSNLGHEPRILNLTSGSFVTFNDTLIYLTSGVILWSIAGALLIYFLLTIPADAVYDYDYYGGGFTKKSQGR